MDFHTKFFYNLKCEIIKTLSKTNNGGLINELVIEYRIKAFIK